MSNAPVPTVREIWQAFLVAFYTCVATFLGGIINDADGLTHVPDWKLAVQAGIAAGLAAVGWGVLHRSARGNARLTP